MWEKCINCGKYKKSTEKWGEVDWYNDEPPSDFKMSVCPDCYEAVDKIIRENNYNILRKLW